MREGWIIRKLGDICSSFSGYTPSGDLLHEVGAYPYFKVAEMNRPENLKVMSSTNAFIDNPAKVYRKGAIVFPKNGAAISTNKKRILGQDSVVDLNTGGFLANEELISPFFLYYLMQHVDFKQYVRRGTVPTLDIKELKAKDCCIPPVQEQELIVAELDCLTGIIEKKKQQLEELDKLAQSIFYDMFGDPNVNNEHWQTVKFSETCQNLDYMRRPITAKDRVAGTIPYYGASGIVDWVKDFIFDGDYLLISEDGANLLMRHSPIAFCAKGKSWVNNHAHILQFEHLYELCFMEHFINLMDLSSLITGAAQPKLTQANLNSIDVFVIQSSSKVEFAQKIEAIEKQKELVKQSIAETETLFNSRMNYWFN